METESSQEGVPFFSVVIPTHGRRAALRRCLGTLASQDYPRDRFEVIVVDDGSRPPVEIEAGALPGVRYELIRQDQAGPAAARNRGASRARGRYLVFLDDDCLAVPGWLAALEQGFEAHPDGALLGGGVTNPHPENVSAEIAEMIVEVLLDRYRPEAGGDYFFRSMNMALGAREFEECGGFDASFMTAEDREFCDRWLHRGGAMIRVPAAEVAHASVLTFRDFVGRHYRYGNGAYRFHAIRKRRSSGRLSPSVLGFYAAVFSRCFRPPARKIAPRVALTVAWQASNAAGFVAELVRARVIDRSTAGQLPQRADQ